MTKYRFIQDKYKCYIQQRNKNMLFGEWETIHSFIGCSALCREITRMLNKCDKETKIRKKKFYDRVRRL